MGLFVFSEISGKFGDMIKLVDIVNLLKITLIYSKQTVTVKNYVFYKNNQIFVPNSKVFWGGRLFCLSYN